MIQVFQPAVGQEELDAVRRVFESNWLGKGQVTKRFEEAFAEHLDVHPAHVISVSCATEGLFQVLDLLRPDHVLLPTISFVGVSNAAIAAGCSLVLCDVNSRTLNPGVREIEPVLGKLQGTVAIILLHYGGVPSELSEIVKLVAHRPLTYLIEDCAGAIASHDHGQPCGTFGRFGVWSFDAMKTLTTGDGGMVYCHDTGHAEALRRRLYLGMDAESGMSSTAQCWWEFHSTGQGRRAVMNDIASAMGLEQLKKLPSFIKRRRAVWHSYDWKLSACRDWLSVPPPLAGGIGSSYTFYWVQLEQRDELAQYLREHGVYTTFRYYPLHCVYGFNESFPNADWAADHTLLLPLHQGLSDTDVEYVCEQVVTFGRERVASAHRVAA